MSVLSPKPRALAGEPTTKVWRYVRLGDIAKTASGGTPKRTSPSFYGGNIPWVKSGELGDSVVYETEESITEAGLKGSSAKIFPKGTLCVALYGATVGKLGVLGMDAATNQAVCGIFLPPELDTRFAYRFLESKRRELVEMGKGGAQPNISQEIIRDLQFPLPPLDEQREIVAEIEKQFTRLEAGVGALKRVQANLKRYRAAVLKAACEGKLVPTEAELAKKKPETGNLKPEFETGEQLLQRILTERRANWTGRGKYKEPAAPNTTDLPKLPEGWTYASVESVGFVQLGRQRAPQHHKGENMRPYLRVANVFEDRIDLSDVMEMNWLLAIFSGWVGVSRVALRVGVSRP
jgi:type I restriction enzyme S subunit